MGARGLSGRDLPNLRVADSAETFAETVLSLLDGYPDAASAAAANRSNGSSSDCLKRFVQLCAELGVEVGSAPANQRRMVAE
jgi:hypothetical protein